MRRPLETLMAALDLVLAPLTFVAALWLGLVRRAGVHRMRIARALFRATGTFPVRDHYYEPLFHPKRLREPLTRPRALPGIALDAPAQLARLDTLRYEDELRAIRDGRQDGRGFSFDNEAFGPGDAEILYAMVRRHRPRRIVEIGSGNSTRIAAAAVLRNRAEDAAYACEHVCIEPYEMPWLESLGVRVLRERVETVDRGLFTALAPGDLLFIDSSHVIRPQGDVLCEYLDILPRVAPGVLVHVHDIFTPRDYREEWVTERVRFWNEQYLVEAILSFGTGLRVLLALNFLAHAHRDALAARCPVFAERPASEPGSLWMVRG